MNVVGIEMKDQVVVVDDATKGEEVTDEGPKD